MRDMAGRSRRVNAVMSAVRATARSFAHVLHLLWLEVTGTIFLAMACFGAFALAVFYAGPSLAAEVCCGARDCRSSRHRYLFHDHICLVRAEFFLEGPPERPETVSHVLTGKLHKSFGLAE